MEVLEALFGSVYRLFSTDLNLFGFSFSFWQIMIFTTIAGITLRFVGRVFFD